MPYEPKKCFLSYNLLFFASTSSVFVDELNYMKSNILDPLVQNGKAIDFHELMFKFTLDSFVLLVFFDGEV
jgi:hypothetical protein